MPNAIAGYNFLFVSSFVASALAVCWVCRRSGLSWAAALLAGWMYAFTPFRLAQMTHIQMLIVQWAPLTLWFWDRLLAERTTRNAALFLTFYLLNLTGGCYLAYMIHFPLLALFANRAASEGRELLSPRSLRRLLPVGLIAGAAILALFLPYLRISKSLGLVRTDEEIREFGATPASYLSPSRANLYFGPEGRHLLHAALGAGARAFSRPEGELFAGFLPTALFLVGAAARWRRRREAPPGPLGAGARPLRPPLFPALTFPWIYAPLMRIVPGMSGMRVPARFYAFVSLTLVYFAARGVDVLRERMRGPRTRAALVAVLAAGLLLELAPRPLRWGKPLPREEAFPAVYRWIAREPAVRALIELPIHDDMRENLYIYYSTLHWKPLANGYSGYIPESHRRLTERIRFLPDSGGLDLLRDLRISHLVVHAQTPGRKAALRDWEGRFAAGEGRRAERVYQEGDDWVYRLLEPSTSSSSPKRAGL